MVTRIHTVAFQGIETIPVEVQVHLGTGLPAFTIVGLPDNTVRESRERVRAALASMGIQLPAKKILVNLAPADVQKEGSHFDVPIALALLVALNFLPEDSVEGYVALGELALDGALQPVAGVLPAALSASAQGKGILCPEGNGAEAAFAGDIDILAPASLLALVNHVKGQQVLGRPEARFSVPSNSGPDLAEVRGQTLAKRALEIAAAGGHNLLLIGPPGSGKSMLAACLPAILPPMSPQEILETNLIASVAGKLVKGGGFADRRPYRDPHHSSSMASMVGGGRRAVPGEISLAHHGVLFMDELPEYPRAVLESLRQPLESGQVSVARVEAHVTYPARFQLIAAMNPCRCGYLGDVGRACGKAPRCAADYQSKISGPLLDRIDLHIEVPAVDTLSMLSPAEGEPSVKVAARVAAARERQRARFAQAKVPARTNAELSGDALQQQTALDTESHALLEQATARLNLSMRGLTRVLRVSRTIADLAGAVEVARPHLAEALSYRESPQGKWLEAA